MLGMVIGVGAVVLTLAVGEGARLTIRKPVETLGANLFVVLAGFQRSAGVRAGSGSRRALTEADSKAILELNGILRVSPVVKIIFNWWRVGGTGTPWSWASTKCICPYGTGKRPAAGKWTPWTPNRPLGSSG
jgi:hypothetical protein